jgi:molecular chaperone GrpE (heat shock protein)
MQENPRGSAADSPADATGADTAATGAPETPPTPEELLRQAEAQAKEHYDAWLRARADADNIRKRAQDDIGMRWTASPKPCCRSGTAWRRRSQLRR